jgi:predicted nucleotidyltransferase
MGRKPPDRPEEIFPELVQDLQAALGEDLLGAAVFGSAAGGRYRKNQSDINLMVLVADGAGHRVARLADFVRRFSGAGVAVPVVVTPSYVASSQDVFPIEFLVMGSEHQAIHGQDPLAGVEVDSGHLRLQLERELKAKLMAMRTRLMAGAGDKNALLALIQESLPAFTALFKAYLHLTRGSFPASAGQTLEAMEKAGVELAAFRRMQAVAEGGDKPGRQGLAEMVEDALAELAELNRKVDALEGLEGPASKE